MITTFRVFVTSIIIIIIIIIIISSSSNNNNNNSVVVIIISTVTHNSKALSEFKLRHGLRFFHNTKLISTNVLSADT